MPVPYSGSGSGLEVPDHAFKLWFYVVIALVILFLISVAFVVTVVSCNHCIEKKNKVESVEEFVPKTKQGIRRGAGTSVYSVKSQDEFLELVNISAENTPTEELAHSQSDQDHDTLETMRPLISPANSSENNTTDIQPEHEDAETSLIENNAGAVGENNTASSHQPTAPDITDGQGAASEAEEEEHPPLTRRFTFEDGSILQDYPTSYDPEISDSDRLDVKPPPTIYSSQILVDLAGSERDDTVSPIEVDVVIEPELSVPLDLPTVVIEEVGEQETYATEPPVEQEQEAWIVPDDVLASTDASKAINELQIPAIESPSHHQFTLSSDIDKTAEGLSDELFLQLPPPSNQQDDNEHYAVPFVKTKSSNHDTIVDPTTLFDDPNYMRGMLAQMGLLGGDTSELEESGVTSTENTTEIIPPIPPRQSLTSTKRDNELPPLETYTIFKTTAVVIPSHTHHPSEACDLGATGGNVNVSTKTPTATLSSMDPLGWTNETSDNEIKGSVKGSTKSEEGVTPKDTLQWLGFKEEDFGELDPDLADFLKGQGNTHSEGQSYRDLTL